MNWEVYQSLHQFESCQESIFVHFALADRVDNDEQVHRIYACTSFGPDWGNLPAEDAGIAPKPFATADNATYQVGSWPDQSGLSVTAHARTTIAQFRAYIANGFAPVRGPTMLMASVGQASFGMWIGEGLQNQIIGSSALKTFASTLSSDEFDNIASAAMQYCSPHQTSEHVFGIIVTGNSTFTAVQNALQSWSEAKCLSFPQVRNVTGPAIFNTPLFDTSMSFSHGTSTTTSKEVNATQVGGNSTAVVRLVSVEKTGNVRRSDCRTIQVVSGDSCASLAQRCGVTGEDFTNYNPANGFCGSLQPFEHVCCTSGTLPNLALRPNQDGSCASYTIAANDNCAVIAAKYGISLEQLTSFNDHTWGWSGCSNIWLGTVICISPGSPPMPAPLTNAVCGPQVPGTARPPTGVDISSLNPCPLNACCNIWGQVSQSSFDARASNAITSSSVF
jgi:LysM repeat protein